MDRVASRRQEKIGQLRRKRIVDRKFQAEYGRGSSRSIAEAAAKRKHSRISSAWCNGSRSFPPRFSHYFLASFAVWLWASAVSRRDQAAGEFGAPFGRSSRLNAQGLRSETSPLKWGKPHKAENPPAPMKVPEGSVQPISPEPAPSHRPWASARARPLAEDRCRDQSRQTSRFIATPRWWHPATRLRPPSAPYARLPAARPSWRVC